MFAPPSEPQSFNFSRRSFFSAFIIASYEDDEATTKKELQREGRLKSTRIKETAGCVMALSLLAVSGCGQPFHGQGQLSHKSQVFLCHQTERPTRCLLRANTMILAMCFRVVNTLLSGFSCSLLEERGVGFVPPCVLLKKSLFFHHQPASLKFIP